MCRFFLVTLRTIKPHKNEKRRGASAKKILRDHFHSTFSVIGGSRVQRNDWLIQLGRKGDRRAEAKQQQREVQRGNVLQRLLLRRRPQARPWHTSVPSSPYFVFVVVVVTFSKLFHFESNFFFWSLGIWIQCDQIFSCVKI